MRVAFYTLGCKLNQCESEALAAAVTGRGFFVSSVRDEADIYIINTCTVTSMAEQKARRMIRKILREHPRARVIVTGCYAQLEKEAIGRLADRLIIVTQDEKHILLSMIGALEPRTDLPALLEEIRAGRHERSDTFAYQDNAPAYHTRPFLKIQDGCDNRCAYCRVPLARGNSVSLKAEEVFRRLQDLDEKGFREVVLTGVNITSYRDGEVRLEDLLKRILERAFGFRVRLSSLEPDMITDTLVDLLEDERICPHFHIPVQSGSDSILAAMGRHYDAAGVRRVVELLAGTRDDPFIAADIITGLPGERDADFQDTLRLIEDLPFSHLHVFPFSPRPGTRAFTMTGRVPERVAGERSAELLARSESLSADYLSRWTGRQVHMILLGTRKGGGEEWVGISENYLQLPVTGIPEGKAAPGKLCGAEIGNRKGEFYAQWKVF